MPTYFPKFTGKTANPPKSKELFLQRKYYKVGTTILYNQINNNYIDLWYDVPYYGKIDAQGFLVAPRTDSMVYVANGDLVTFDFIAQAFNEMVYFLRRATAAGKTAFLEPLLNDYKPVESFLDSENTYLAYASSIIHLFNSEIVVKSQRILNFDSYVCCFLKYLFSTQRSFFSYYSIFASFLTPVGSTGLSISFNAEDHDDDSLKNRYFLNNEFAKYVNTMANFGFRINKNAPWQIIADLNSKPMLQGRPIKTTNPETGEITTTMMTPYMHQHFIPDIKTFFAQNYNRVMTRSLFLLKSILTYGYSTYQSKTGYVVSHAAAQLNFNKSIKLITFADVFRPHAAKLLIKSYNTKNGNNKMHFTSTDWKAFGYSEMYFIKILEKILRHEYEVKNDRRYHHFKKNFDRNMKSESYSKMLEMLEQFYSPTNIYDPETKQLLWNMPQNQLTSKKEKKMIPNDQQKPTVEKTVSEYFTGF